MKELQVKIEQLEPMRVAAALGFGKNPEDLAFEKMVKFAEAKGLLVDGQLPITYGFNNPDPSPGSPNYGYEVWLPVSENIGAGEDVTIVDFPGGLYAVTRFQGVDNIGDVWKQLVNWREKSEYQWGNHQWLEKLLTPSETDYGKFVFELFLPISEN